MRRPDELIGAVRIPLPLAPLTGFHKIAKRRFDDISSVAVAIALQPRRRAGRGGPHRPRRGGRDPAARHRHRGGAHRAPLDPRRPRSRCGEVLGGEGTPLDDHRASAAYRSAMLRRSLEKFLHETTGRTGQEQGVPA